MKGKYVVPPNNYLTVDISIAPTLLGRLAEGQKVRYQESGITRTGWLRSASTTSVSIGDGAIETSYPWDHIDWLEVVL